MPDIVGSLTRLIGRMMIAGDRVHITGLVGEQSVGVDGQILEGRRDAIGGISGRVSSVAT